jgi:hypothetical protein
VWPQSVAPAHDRTGADSLLVAAATVAVVAILFHMLIVLLFALVLFAAVCLVHNYPLSSFLILRTTVYRIAPSFVKSPACRPDLSAPLTPLYAPLRGYHTAGKVSIPASNLGPSTGRVRLRQFPAIDKRKPRLAERIGYAAPGLPTGEPTPTGERGSCSTNSSHAYGEKQEPHTDHSHNAPSRTVTHA